MKYLVVSDIHGSGYYANKIEEIFSRENPDKCAGMCGEHI